MPSPTPCAHGLRKPARLRWPCSATDLSLSVPQMPVFSAARWPLVLAMRPVRTGYLGAESPYSRSSNPATMADCEEQLSRNRTYAWRARRDSSSAAGSAVRRSDARQRTARTDRGGR
jgi:hypothetical protein